MNVIKALVKEWKKELEQIKTVDVQPRIEAIIHENEENLKHLFSFNDKISENDQKKQILENDIESNKKF